MLDLSRFRFEREPGQEEPKACILKTYDDSVSNDGAGPGGATRPQGRDYKQTKSKTKRTKTRILIDLTNEDRQELETLSILSGKPLKVAKKRLSRRPKPQFGVVSPQAGVSQIRALTAGLLSPTRHRSLTEGRDQVQLQPEGTVTWQSGRTSLVAKASKQPSDLTEEDFAVLHQHTLVEIPQTPEYNDTEYDLIPSASDKTRRLKAVPDKSNEQAHSECSKLKEKGRLLKRETQDSLYIRLTTCLKTGSEPKAHEWWTKILMYEPLSLAEFIPYIQKTLAIPLTKPQIRKWCDLRGIIVKE